MNRPAGISFHGSPGLEGEVGASTAHSRKASNPIQYANFTGHHAMESRLFICALTALSLSSGIASAQRTVPATSDQGSSGNPFTFQGDQIQPMPDPAHRADPRDPRYSQTVQQQQNGEIPKPGGGCLRYGAVGAAGGHLAGHGVLGAIAGCATGAYVRHRDKARIADQYGKQ